MAEATTPGTSVRRISASASTRPSACTRTTDRTEGGIGDVLVTRWANRPGRPAGAAPPAGPQQRGSAPAREKLPPAPGAGGGTSVPLPGGARGGGGGRE